MTRLADTSTPVLEVEHLECRFGGLRALADVSLRVRRNTIAGVIGPNGAGKTTLFNLVTKTVAPTQGRILLGGKDVTGLRSDQLVARGLARTFQQVRLFPGMTALENVMAARFVKSRSYLAAQLLGLPAARKQQRQDERDARSLLERVGVDRHDVLASKLGFLEQHLVEIARALATDPTVLLLDEPSTGMVEAEVAQLESLIRGIRAEGVTVLIVEHNMRLVMRLCEHIWVLNFGRLIAEGNPQAIGKNADVVEAYLGGVHDVAA